MSAAKGGGPAFPRIRSYVDTFGFVHQESDGMTLRDYFAGQALAGMLAGADSWPDSKITANAAYCVADAMLAERAK